MIQNLRASNKHVTNTRIIKSYLRHAKDCQLARKQAPWDGVLLFARTVAPWVQRIECIRLKQAIRCATIDHLDTAAESACA